MAIITEDYVSFETAKLLNEKGFDEPCIAYWFHMINAEPILQDNMPRQVYNNKSDTIEIIGCPTLQMAMKWLREVHKLSVRARYDEVEDEKEQLHYVWFFDILSMNPYKTLVEPEQGYYTYEDAAEAAIKYCLENLI